MLFWEWWGQLLVLAIFAVVVWFAIQPRSAFVVRVAHGQPITVRGKVTAAFLERIRETCEEHGVRNATIRGVARDKRINLAFSWGMPVGCRQQLRNWWANWGWSAKPLRA
jgi:hypothetical protein